MLARRLFPLLAVLAAAAVLPATPAQAIQSTQTLKASVTPNKAGTVKKPRAVALTVHPSLDPFIAAEPAFAVLKAEILLPKALVFNGAKFPVCSEGMIFQHKCPARTKIGAGKGTGFALSILEELDITAYNGSRKGDVLNMYVDGHEPLTIDDNIAGRLTKVKGSKDYGWKLFVPIPTQLQEPAQGVFATLTSFEVRIKATAKVKGRSVPYVGLTGCPKGGLKVASRFWFSDSTSQPANTVVPCRR